MFNVTVVSSNRVRRKFYQFLWALYQLFTTGSLIDDSESTLGVLPLVYVKKKPGDNCLALLLEAEVLNYDVFDESFHNHIMLWSFV